MGQRLTRLKLIYMICGEYFIYHNQPPIEQLMIQSESRQLDLKIAQATLVNELQKRSILSDDQPAKTNNSPESSLFDVEQEKFSPII